MRALADENQPGPISEPMEEALLRNIRPDFLEQSKAKKERHRKEKKAIERAMRRAKQSLKRLFGQVLERSKAEL